MENNFSDVRISVSITVYRVADRYTSDALADVELKEQVSMTASGIKDNVVRMVGEAEYKTLTALGIKLAGL